MDSQSISNGTPGSAVVRQCFTGPGTGVVLGEPGFELGERGRRDRFGPRRVESLFPRESGYTKNSKAVTVALQSRAWPAAGGGRFYGGATEEIDKTRVFLVSEGTPATAPNIPLHQESAGYSLRPFRCLLSKRLASINVRIASSRLCTSSRKASTVGDDGMPRRQVNRNSTGAEAGWNG
jgi:hypothetical protein